MSLSYELPELADVEADQLRLVAIAEDAGAPPPAGCERPSQRHARWAESAPPSQGSRGADQASRPTRATS